MVTEETLSPQEYQKKMMGSLQVILQPNTSEKRMGTIFRMLVACSEGGVILAPDEARKQKILFEINHFKLNYQDMWNSVGLHDPKVVTPEEVQPKNNPQFFIDEALCFFNIKD